MSATPGTHLAESEHKTSLGEFSVKSNKRNMLLVGLLGATIFSTGMLAHYSYQVYSAAEKANHAAKLVAKEDSALLVFNITLDKFFLAAGKFGSGTPREINDLADSYQNTRKSFADFDALTRELVWDDAGKRAYKNALNIAMQRIDATMASFAEDPKAKTTLISNLVDAERHLGEVGIEMGKNHSAYMETLGNQLDDEWKRLRIYGASAFTIWLVSAMLMLAYVGRARRQAAQILLEKQKIDVASKEALAAKNHFLGMISHELRTPLQAITASIDLLTERYTTDSDKRLLNRLNIALSNLGQQLRDLTDYTRLDTGKLELREEEVNPTGFLSYVVEEHRAAATEKGLGLFLRIDERDRDCVVITDPYRFQQIANNLLSNAIKYTETGQIVVWLHVQSTEPTSILLKVHDTGPGIPEDQINNIFEPFTQIDKGSTRRHDGTGMGLAIVQKLVNLLNGKLNVRSTLGQGSRFEVTLPVVLRRVQSRTSAAIPPTETNVWRILLVDDNMAIRQSLRDCVVQCGYPCDEASGGNEAIVKAHETTYAAILLDINMKDVDGYDVAAAIRKKIGPNQNAPIIAVTGNYNGTDEQKKPFTDFLGKPVRLQDIRQMLKKYVDGVGDDPSESETPSKEPWNIAGRIG